jgi:cysteine-rich repeat protein
MRAATLFFGCLLRAVSACDVTVTVNDGFGDNIIGVGDIRIGSSVVDLVGGWTTTIDTTRTVAAAPYVLSMRTSDGFAPGETTVSKVVANGIEVTSCVNKAFTPSTGAWTDLCSFATQCATPVVCGDGQVAGTEVCDDGNTSSGDGCSSTCTREVFCGDGFVFGTDQCDDGNNVHDRGRLRVRRHGWPGVVLAAVHCLDRPHRQL